MTVKVNATPTGPAKPSKPWRVLLADGFNSAKPLSHFWGPNRNNNAGDDGKHADCSGFNADEVQRFNASRVKLSEGGLHLTAAWRPKPIPGGPDYVSGCVSSQPVEPLGGQAGFPILGFGFVQTPGVRIVLEAVIKLPPFFMGMDFGWWAQGPGTGANEIDFFEFTNYVEGKPGQWGAQTAWINHLSGESNGDGYYNQPWQNGGKSHRYTTEIDGASGFVRSFVDGQELGSYSWITPPPGGAYCNLILSHALRNAYPGQGPSFADSRTVVVRSVACYADTAARVSVGGGIAAGTVLG